MTRASGTTKPAEDTAWVNPLAWFSIFNESRLLACLMEVLKNGFDWDAHVIRLITDESREQLRHVDDGCGMSALNRQAFLSVGYSTAGGDQSGTFGTGAKKIIFTFAKKVRVVTAPADEPNLVYLAEFSPMQLAEAYSGKSTQFWRSERKTRQNWPHKHPTGTDTTYMLKDPRSRSILRGATLAKKLSERLDIVLIEGGMVLVDGERLPAKQLSGRIYRLELAASGPLGRVQLEFYRPAHRASGEDLRMTGRAIGEVSFRDTLVKQLLTQELREQVPALFGEADVCGLITAGFLNEHITERRDSYDAAIVDDERLVELLRLLRSVEADVASYLGIKLRSDEDPEAEGRAAVEEFIDRLQARYNPGHQVPAGFNPSAGERPGPQGRRRGGRKVPPPVKGPELVIERPEYALDEAIVVKLLVPDGTPEGFHFYLEQAHAKVESVGDGAARLIACELGRGLIRAANPKTGQVAKVEYEVVAERVFHLSVPGPIGIPVGGSFTVAAVNADKLRGPITWQVDGPGELTVLDNGRRARYSATAAGKAQIVAFDATTPTVRSTCDVHVLQSQSGQLPFCIRDEFFVAEFRQTDLTAYRKPATIVQAGAHQVHRLVFNQLAPGFSVAVETGTLQQVLAYATAVEFAKHFLVDWDDVDPSDLQSVLLEVQNAAAELFSEMLGG